MPYKVKSTPGGGAVLIKRDTGKVVSHHKSKAKANAAIRAIYIHEHDVPVRPKRS